MARLIVVLVVIVVGISIVLAMTGVMHFQNTNDQSTITIDKKDLQKKSEKAVEKTEEAGGKILDKTGEALHKAADDLRGRAKDPPAPTATQPPVPSPVHR
jgi:hypothetical protein